MNKKKSSGSFKAFKKFLVSIKSYRLLIIISIVLAIGSAVLGIFIPKILGDMTNVAVETYPNINFDIIVGKVWLIVGLFIGSAILNYAQAYILTVVSAKYTRKLRNQIIEKISKLPISYFDRHKIGDTLSRMTNDVDVIATSMSQEITDVSLSLSILIGNIVMMLTISVSLSLISFVVVPLSVLVVGKIMKHAQKYFIERQNTLGSLNSIVEEDYAGQVIIKSNSHENISLQKFNDINSKLSKITMKAQFLSALAFPVTHIFTNLGYIAVVAVGGILTIQGRITIGSLQAFIQYVSRFNRPITEIASTTTTMQSLLASSERIFDFLNEPEEAPDPEPSKTIEKVKGEVEFHDVNFGYFEDKPVIRNFSAKIEPGMNVAIVGPTGAGKTTLINLLMRFYDPDSGYITIDGVPTREMKRKDVMNF